ncbi:hypothetical protein BKA58DRAFT_403128 [Alternaria rosae]|uniref:uncharacterized protein n=1 Tax=Alternaria rosae TaxID=1187941 RepID=UPI001E8CC3D0|nr:uncharacterized protein BKA58DRAFT_403128 [Alternaria rosae]KAH6868792.1 hypothetical protein BKA58DRAFT_403128 [Alternaria rosae]
MTSERVDLNNDFTPHMHVQLRKAQKHPEHLLILFAQLTHFAEGTCLPGLQRPSTGQETHSANRDLASRCPGLAVQDHHDLDIYQPLLKHLPLSQAYAMSQSDKPFASAKSHIHDIAGPVSCSPLRRRRARSLSSSLPPRGTVASLVDNTNMASPPTEVAMSIESDCDTLPSQAKTSSPTTTSRPRPGTRTTHSSPLKHKCKIDDFVLPPPPPIRSANDAAPDAILAASNLVTSNDKGIVQDEALNDEPFKVLGDSKTGSTPFHRCHRRNKTSLSQVVSRSDPLKGAAYGTESFRVTAGQYSHWTPGPYGTSSPNDDLGVDGFSNVTSSEASAIKRELVPGSSSPSSITALTNPNEPNNHTRPPKTTAGETEEKKRTPSISSYNSSSAASSPKIGGSPPGAELDRPLRRTEKFNFYTRPSSQYGCALTLLEVDTDEAHQLYPLETFAQAIAEDGCLVHDWACPWPSEQPVKKLLRFASRPDFAPSVHYESEPDNYPSLQKLLDMDEHDPEPRKRPLSVVNVPDQTQDDGLTTLAPVSYYPDTGSEMTILLPRTYNATSDDDEMTFPPRTYNATGSDGLMCLLPLKYDANAANALENASSIKRKPIPRQAKDRSLRFPALPPDSSNWVVHDGYEADESVWTQSSGCFSMNTEASDLRYSDSFVNRDAGIEPIHIEKRHKCNGSKTTLDQTANPVGNFIESHSNVDSIKEPASIGTIKRRTLPSISVILDPPFPTNTGVLNLDFQFPARKPQQRGASMPVLPPPLAKLREEKKHMRRSSFGKLLGAFGKKGQESAAVEAKEKPEKSLGRRISKRFSSMWLK